MRRFLIFLLLALIMTGIVHAGQPPPTRPPLLTMQHDGWVTSAWWSNDGARILSSAADGTVRVWDAATGTELLRMNHEPDVTVYAMWSADNSQILSWATDDTIRLWDAVTGDELQVFRHITSLTLNSLTVRWIQEQGRIISYSGEPDTCCSYAYLHLWNVDTGEELLRLTYDYDALITLARTNTSSTQLLTAANNGIIRIYDMMTAELLLEVQHPIRGQESIVVLWNADETRLLSYNLVPVNCEVDCETRIHIWEAATGELFTTHTVSHPIIPVWYEQDINEIIYVIGDGENEVNVVWNINSDTREEIVIERGGWESISPSGRYRMVEIQLYGPRAPLNSYEIYDVTTGELVAETSDSAFFPLNWGPADTLLQTRSSNLDWGPDGTIVFTEESRPISIQFDALTDEVLLVVTGYWHGINSAGDRILTTFENELYISDAAYAEE